MANRLSQEMAEVLNAPPSALVHSRLTQLVAEVLCTLTAIPPPAPIGTTGKWFKDLWFTDPEELERYDMGEGISTS
jgi:hypothetical protein